MQFNLARSFRVPYLKHLAFLLASMLITLSCSVHATPTNLLTNPSFETLPLNQDWSVFGSAGALNSSSVAHTGTSSALVNSRTAFYGGVSQDINGVLTAGVTYDVSAWVRLANPVTFDISDSTLTESIKFEMNIKQTDGSGTQYISIDTSASENVNNWIKLFGQFTYQPNGAVSALNFYVHGPDAGIDILVDDVAIYAPESYTTTPHTSSDFVQAQGRQLVVGAANAPIRLIGVNFNAYAEEDEAADIIFSGNNYDADSYQDVANMGLTVVRLDLWWKLFEDENNPYTYKQAGWDWLNKNINWARDAGVYLILDMHAPHGGFQGPGYSGGFWSNSDYKARTKALWSEIASRYKDEIVIAAYDIFNEPAAPATSQLVTYSQELVDAIRLVDTNHLLIVEIDYGDNSTGPFLITDSASNVMYDFHQYAPWYH
ncbi:cellulase family glycosylhydrolase, partial [Candidatus Albibeggiatoa sp. nov. BB20]|uniref:cellulase family glycosylhydrolase n=1 Tax=Candidatus Albibeggiatoa sp. nov. BB20 TaxID=3162723 RepID=UPI00336539A6